MDENSDQTGSNEEDDDDDGEYEEYDDVDDDDIDCESTFYEEPRHTNTQLSRRKIAFTQIVTNDDETIKKNIRIRSKRKPSNKIKYRYQVALQALPIQEEEDEEPGPSTSISTKSHSNSNVDVHNSYSMNSIESKKDSTVILSMGHQKHVTVRIDDSDDDDDDDICFDRKNPKITENDSLLVAYDTV